MKCLQLELSSHPTAAELCTQGTAVISILKKLNMSNPFQLTFNKSVFTWCLRYSINLEFFIKLRKLKSTNFAHPTTMVLLLRFSI